MLFNNMPSNSILNRDWLSGEPGGVKEIQYNQHGNALSSRDLTQPGALVISLDFELHWGYRDRVQLDCKQRKKLLSARAMIPRILDLFEEFSINATWATVGFLFARSKDQLEKFRPEHRPTYRETHLDPYEEKLGSSESDDPFHFAPGLIAEIAKRPGQEIASHSFSHYYCLEEGQTAAQFEADVCSAIAIAADAGYAIASYVFPRNQVNISYLPALRRANIYTYRATEPAKVKAPTSYRGQRRAFCRLTRLADSYIDIHGPQTVRWLAETDPACIAASRYLRPYNRLFAPLENLRLQRIKQAMEHAAKHGQIFHLWWHPEDFAWHGEQNLYFLRRVLSSFNACRKTYGMRSLSMAEVPNQAVMRPNLLHSSRCAS
ncbi:MAG: polysaccharide deacetylase family protein [Acidobacteriaceae bacterium]|nr:polysaccharide deacetylase family protein [Acidobacteriaceae bacterium]